MPGNQLNEKQFSAAAAAAFHVRVDNSLDDHSLLPLSTLSDSLIPGSLTIRGTQKSNS